MVLLLVAALASGTVVHLEQLLTSGGHPNPGLPTWLGAYLVSLTVAVLVTDATANALANYACDPAPGITAGRIGKAVITCLALGAVAAARAMWRGARTWYPCTHDSCTLR